MSKSKIGIIGSGVVAQVLASGFIKHGYPVVLGTRDASKLADFVSKEPSASITSVPEAALAADIILLAVKGTATLAAVRSATAENVGNKIVIDATNPIRDDVGPDNGSLRYFTTNDESLLEQLQKEFPNARFVKAFNSVGNSRMVDPQMEDGTPTMFICGNDESAKQTVSEILLEFGNDPFDVGGVEMGRSVEALCVLWCGIGFNKGSWSHAFKLLRK